MRARVEEWLVRFGLDPFLHQHVTEVFVHLPAHVREDMMEDERFRLIDYAPGPSGMRLAVGIPGLGVLGNSRCVVLKRTLSERATGFVRWVIAHELAHAHLRNDGRRPGEDPEQAADALAAEWGFPRP